MLPTLLGIVAVVIVGVAIVVYRHRSAGGIESGISSFRRELRALAPPDAERSTQTLSPDDVDGPTGSGDDDPTNGR